MIKILFICHGNICRSPMSEFILKDMVEKRGIKDKFDIASAATSTEEIWQFYISAGTGRTKKTRNWKDCVYQFQQQAGTTGHKAGLQLL